jgi:lysophospholipase L1-like esterase
MPEKTLFNIFCMKSIVTIAILLFWGNPKTTAQPFKNEIDAFKKQDSISMPPKGAVLFTGSSSIRLWQTLAEAFPRYTVINRGFGGSSLPDVEYYLKDIVFPYYPSRIVLYCGENDFASSDTVTVQTVYERFVSLYLGIRVKYPLVPFVYISMKPSPSRRKHMPAMAKANERIRHYLRYQPHTRYADVYSPMLNKQGQPIPELFVKDSLHMSAKGYQIWQKVLKRHL